MKKYHYVASNFEINVPGGCLPEKIHFVVLASVHSGEDLGKMRLPCVLLQGPEQHRPLLRAWQGCLQVRKRGKEVKSFDFEALATVGKRQFNADSL